MSSETQAFFLLLCGITALCAVLLFVTWRQYRPSAALGAWAAAYAIAAVALLGTMLRDDLPYLLGVSLSGALLVAAFGLMWIALRAIRSAPWRWPVALLPAACWFGLTLLPFLRHSSGLRLLAMGPLVVLGMVAIVRELWRLPRELRMRAPLLTVLAVHAGFYGLRTLAVWFHPIGIDSDTVFRATAVEAVAFAVADSFLMMSLVRERRERDIEAAARTDFLTALLNRAGFATAAALLLARVRRERVGCALLLLDLDHFKQINDRFGHAAGDAVLRRLAASCRAELRSGDVVARIGGDEFAVLVATVTAADTDRLAARLARRFAGPDRNTDGPPVTVSIGVAWDADGTATLDALLADADRSLYARKAVRPAADGGDCGETVRVRERIVQRAIRGNGRRPEKGLGPDAAVPASTGRRPGERSVPDRFSLR